MIIIITINHRQNSSHSSNNASISQAQATIQVITGMGGVGKTQTSLAYAKRYYALYNHNIRRIITTDQTAIEKGFREFAKDLGINVIDPISNTPRNMKEVVKEIYQKLKHLDRCLIIFDDVSSYDQIKYFLPSAEGNLTPVESSKFDILITSRHQSWDCDNARVQVKKLDIFTPSEAESYIELVLGDILRDSSEEEQQEFRANSKKLAELLGRLPLALEQAVYFIRQTDGINIAEYIKLYNQTLEGRKELLKSCRKSGRAYDKTVMTCFDITFQAIKRRAKDTNYGDQGTYKKALEILQYLPYCQNSFYS